VNCVHLLVVLALSTAARAATCSLARRASNSFTARLRI